LATTAQGGLLAGEPDDTNADWKRWTKLANARASHIVQVFSTHLYVGTTDAQRCLAFQQRVHGWKSCWLVGMRVVLVIDERMTALESDAWIC
jgi:hypothetical protein